MNVDKPPTQRLKSETYYETLNLLQQQNEANNNNNEVRSVVDLENS